MYEPLWAQNNNGEWWQLHILDLNWIPETSEGVYVIWQDDPELMDVKLPVNPTTVYVGQGNIQGRLKKHRKEKRIRGYARGPFSVFVTWANVPESAQHLPRFRDGVERYLADVLEPQEGSHHPDAPPIPVSLPGALGCWRA